MTDQLTPWYDPKVDGQPVRVGWYQRYYYKTNGDFASFPDYWDNEKWYLGFGHEILHTKFPSSDQYLPWRGLTEPNEEKQ